MHFGYRSFARGHRTAHRLDLIRALDHAGEFSHFLAAANFDRQCIQGAQAGDFDSIHRKPTIDTGVLAQQLVDLRGEMSGVSVGVLTGLEKEKDAPLRNSVTSGKWADR
ncbi:hypothetical protein QZH46_11390 [Pseudomonas corrugata]